MRFKENKEFIKRERELEEKKEEEKVEEKKDEDILKEVDECKEDEEEALVIDRGVDIQRWYSLINKGEVFTGGEISLEDYNRGKPWLCISSGSVVYFKGDAIVNAANELMLGGGGIDGAISRSGGSKLQQARAAMPLISPSVRCKTGDAKITSATENFGSLLVKNVIHAVGPNYNIMSSENGDKMLTSAYKNTMNIAKLSKLKIFAFSLLSAGIFKGDKSLKEVLHMGIETVVNNSYEALNEVHLVGYLREEVSTLIESADEILR